MLRDDVMRASADGWATVTANVDVDRAFACEFAFAVDGAGSVARAMRVCSARSVEGATEVAGWLLDCYPAVPAQGCGVDVSWVSVEFDATWFTRSAQETRELVRLRRHWDERYSRPGRVPLTHPSAGLVAWAGDVAGRVLLLGDGEGRNVAAFSAACDVTMVELSPVAAAACERLVGPRTRVVCADLFRWLSGTSSRWDCVALLYLGPFSAREFGVLVGFLAEGCARGARVYLELAAVAVTQAQVDALARLPHVCVERFCNGPDDIDRVRICSR